MDKTGYPELVQIIAKNGYQIFGRIVKMILPGFPGCTV
jgi:hypothetical protein